MKRLLTLLTTALIALVIAVPDARAQQKTIAVAPSTGTFYRDSGGTSSWKDRWVSDDSPVITIANADGSTTNNMSFDEDLDAIKLAEGSNSQTYDFTISVEAGYVITGMSFTILCGSGVEDITVTIGDDHAIAVSSTAQDVTITGLDSRSVNIDVSSTDGKNEECTIYNWTVTVEPSQEKLTAATMTIAPSTGTFYRDSGGTSAWKDRWVSDDSPVITIANADGSTTNNMSFDEDLDAILLAEGSGSQTYDFTLSVESAYIITGMSFTILCGSGVEDMTVTIGDDNVIAVSSTPQDVVITGLDSSSVNIDLTSTDGTNEQCTIYNWTVTVEPKPVEVTTITRTIAPSTGTFYRDDGASSSWKDRWESTESPVISIVDADGSIINNMSFDNDLDAMLFAEGTNSQTYDFTLSVESGYIITGMSFTIVSLNGVEDMTVTIGDDNVIAVSSTPQDVVITGLDSRTVNIDLSSTDGNNEQCAIYNWTVTLEESPVEKVAATMTVAPSTGTFYRDSGGTSDWKDRWVSTDSPTITLANADGSTTNNMSFNTSLDGMVLAEGSGSLTFDYTLSVESGYVITGMSFTIITDEGINDMTVTVDGTYSVYPSETPQDVEITGLNKRSINIDVTSVSAKNEMCTLYNWLVTVEPREPQTEPDIIISTEEEQHWYYIYSTSTKTYCSGKALYYDEEQDKIRFDGRSYQPKFLWSFWENSDGELAIMSYLGGYVTNLADNNNNFNLAEQANYAFTINYYEEDCFTIYDKNSERADYMYLHAQEDGELLVHWSISSGNASMWNFQEVDLTDSDVALQSTSVVQGKVTTGRGNTADPIIRSTMVFSGVSGMADLQAVSGKVKATDLSDVTGISAYFASNSRELFLDPDNTMPWREQTGELWAKGTIAEDGTYTIEGDKFLEAGTYYLWICLDIAEDATEGNTVDVTIENYTVNGETVTERSGDPTYEATIFLTESTPLMPMDLGSLYYRIPAITTSIDGQRIVILSDDRTDTNGDLPTHVWVVAQYSEDGGLSWSEPVRVAGTAELGGNYGHGDASLVTNRITGDIIGIMTSSPYGTGFSSATPDKTQGWKTIRSRDGGLTWEAPVDHTTSLYGTGSDNYNWYGGFSGSGAALQKRDGTLVSPFVNREANTSGNISQNCYLFMSKDGGESWYVSGTSGTTSADEPKVLERNNGDLAICVRATGYNYTNSTFNDGLSWTKSAQTRFTSGISGNACNGEYLVWCSTLDGNEQDIVLQTAPNNSSRMNVSIALSTDEGETFLSPKTICPRGSAYSAATVLPDGTLGVYYEENGIYGGFTMRFVRFSLDWASDGQFKFTDEHPYHPVQTNVDYEMSEYGWNTVILPFEVTLPDELQAFACLDSTLNYMDGDEMRTAILMEPLEDRVLEARTPYVLAGPEGVYTFNRPLSEWTAGELPENCEYRNGVLVGHFVGNRLYGDGATIYNNLRYIENRGGLGFNRIAENSYVSQTAYTCHVELSKANELTLLPMRTDEIPVPVQAVKEGDDDASAPVYNLQGRLRKPGEKGIFIINGKTVLIN